MKFEITRTSRWFNDKKPPIDEATLVKGYFYEDWRTVDTLDKARKSSWGEDWFKEGKNHREEKDMVVRELWKNDNCWIIEIKDLKELLKLIKQYGDIVIQDSHIKGISFEIEIYDGYRE